MSRQFSNFSDLEGVGSQTKFARRLRGRGRGAVLTIGAEPLGGEDVVGCERSTDSTRVDPSAVADARASGSERDDTSAVVGMAPTAAELRADFERELEMLKTSLERRHAESALELSQLVKRTSACEAALTESPVVPALEDWRDELGEELRELEREVTRRLERTTAEFAADLMNQQDELVERGLRESAERADELGGRLEARLEGGLRRLDAIEEVRVAENSENEAKESPTLTSGTGLQARRGEERLKGVALVCGICAVVVAVAMFASRPDFETADHVPLADAPVVESDDHEPLRRSKVPRRKTNADGPDRGEKRDDHSDPTAADAEVPATYPIGEPVSPEIAPARVADPAPVPAPLPSPVASDATDDDVKQEFGP